MNARGKLTNAEEALLTPRQRAWLPPVGPLGYGVGILLYAALWIVMKLGFRLGVTHAERLPPRQRQVLYAANHASYLDPFALLAALGYRRLRRSRWAANSNIVFANPFNRLVCRAAQVMPVERQALSGANLAMIAAALARGWHLIAFPEGHRSPTGALQPLHRGMGVMARRFNLPIVPLWIEGTFEAMPPGAPWPRWCRRLQVHVGAAATPAELEAAGRGATPEERITDGLRARLELLRPG